MLILKPQPGPQEMFLSTWADIGIYGGAAGGGKTFAILLEPVRHVANPKFAGVIFRRTLKQVKVAGGLWDESMGIYLGLGGEPRETMHDWTFPSGMRLQFSGLEQEKDIYQFQGAQFPFIGFDELTHFTKKQFFYMLSRNRSSSGVPGYVRATCNPDPDSWVKEFIQWWLDPETGLAIPERSGVVRWFIQKDDIIHWADTREELIERFGPGEMPKSATFITATVHDNKILLEKDPNYLANLKALSRVDRERLLNANWNIRPAAGMLFKKFWFEVVDAPPAQFVKVVRCWDRAATEVNAETGEGAGKDPDWTVGLKMGVTRDNIYYVLDVIRVQYSTFKVEQLTLNTAKQDGLGVTVKIFQDPGAAGVMEKDHYLRNLSGFVVETEKIMVNKVTAAKPASAQAEALNIKVVRAAWNEALLTELEAFPDGAHDDQVDAFSGAFNCLSAKNVGTFGDEFNQENKINNHIFNEERPSW